MKRIDSAFKNLDEENKKTICDKVLAEVNEFFESDFKDYDATNYRRFIKSLSQEINDNIDLSKIYLPINNTPEDFIKNLAGITLRKRGNYSFDTVATAYAIRTKKLDKILNELGTRDFCAVKCPKIEPEKKHVGCCDANHYKRTCFPEFFDFQELEAKKKGWVEKGKKEACKYLDLNSGCVLTLFKSPICIGALCIEFIDSLKKEYNKRNVEKFFYEMRNIFDDLMLCKLSKGNWKYLYKDLFKSMNKAITAGRKLVAEKQEKQQIYL